MLRRLLLTCLGLGLVLAATAGGLAWVYAGYLDAIVVEKFAGRRWELPSRVYSDSILIYPGLNVQAAGLFDRLSRLNYREMSDGPLRKGDFRRTKTGLDLFLRDFSHPGQTVTGQLIRIDLRGGVVTGLEDGNSGQELFSLHLEPEVITGLYQSVWEERRLITLDEVPPLLIRAILSAEDQRFFQHHGIDLIGTFRALLVNLRAGRVVQGGSTLTQQLMKNFFLSEERTLRRKLREAAMALVAERRYRKEEILENYLNEIYLGQSGLQGIFGVWEASQFYFARPPMELSLAEMAMLAGLIKAPNRYSPFRHPARAERRRNAVLAMMLEADEIGPTDYALAVDEPLRIAPVRDRFNAAPYFVDFLRKELTHEYPQEVLTSAGLQIFTTLDVELQKLAEQAVQTGLDELERRYPRLKATNPDERLQACLIAIQPQTGEIKAMVGGRDYRSTQFNRAVQARRQPGSVFKPFVYLAAFEESREAPDPITPTSRLDDEPFAWAYGSEVWRPANYRDRYLGTVTVRQGLEFSLNAATARLAHQVGIGPIRDLARRMGITSNLPPYPSMVLGALEVSPFEVAQAYAVLANQGLRAAARATKKVLDQHGQPIERYPVEVVRVASPESAYLVTHLLEGALDHGTGRGARAAGFKRFAAGKTGTTNDYRDAWFAGFTPDLVTVVWVGFDQRKPVGLSGAEAGLPIWTEFMKAATAASAPSPFLPPPGVVLIRIDPQSGGLATPDCPDSIEEAFRKGQEPTARCPLHADALAAPYELQPAWIPPLD